MGVGRRAWCVLVSCCVLVAALFDALAQRHSRGAALALERSSRETTPGPLPSSSSTQSKADGSSDFPPAPPLPLIAIRSARQLHGLAPAHLDPPQP